VGTVVGSWSPGMGHVVSPKKKGVKLSEDMGFQLMWILGFLESRQYGCLSTMILG
jgi:hypothetical protein